MLTRIPFPTKAYPIRGHQLYNISTAHPDTTFFAAENAQAWTSVGSKTQLLQVFHDFCPLVRKMLSLVPDREVLEWRLRTHARLNTRVKGCVALLGDAARFVSFSTNNFEE
jgi:salicylate hydroxylase